MKHILLTVLIFVSLTLMAQVPQGVGYQGVATDSEGIELVNQAISIRASVLSGSANGIIEWEETHSTSTDTFGLFNLTIGQGNNTGNGLQVNFADISWGTNTHFLKIEMDATGGNDFSFMGTNQMMSVPYALYAENTTLDTVSIQNIALGSSLWVEHPTQNKITSPGKSVGVRGYPGELDSTIDLTIYSSGEEYTPSKIRLKGTNENSSYSSWSDLSSSYDNHITSSKFSISTRNMGVMNENFVINSLGYTGIGTTDPIATLHIEPEFPANGLLVNTEYANGGIYIQNTANTSAKLVLNQVGSNNGQAYYLVSRNDGQFVIGNANNGIVDMLTIDSLGNIGITEEAPKADLHITDENDFTDVLIESGGDFEDASLWLKNPSKTWRIHGDQNDIDKFKIGLWTDYSEIGGSLLMEYPFVIDTIGRVGVGAPSPNANLHIYNQDSVVLKVQTNSNGQSGAYLRLNEDNTTGGYVHYKSSGDNSNALRLGTATIGNGDLNMLTLRAGNVGVNTDNPQQTLHVNDVMRLEPRETAPEDPSKGDIYMDDADNKLKYFDGENWQILNGNNSLNEILTGESSNVNDILLPEGINGEPIIISLNPTSPYYIVPSDKRLYILNILSDVDDENSEYRILINNNLIFENFENIKQPIIVNSNDVVSSTNNILNFNGILVDKISGIEALTVTVDINQWQVPDGKKYFIQHVISNEFYIDGIEISESLIDEELTLPIVMDENQTISIPADFNSDDLPSFHGYLVDEDYFENNITQNNTNSDYSSGNMVVSNFGDTLTMNGQSIIIPGISYSNYTPTYSSVTDIDGNTYETTSINGKEWMTEDLAVTRFSNGDPLNQITGTNNWNSSTCASPGYIINNTFSSLGTKIYYNCYVIQDSRNICPIGWHVATEQDYIDVLNLVDTMTLSTTSYGFQWENAGPAFKKQNAGWTSINYPAGLSLNSTYLGFESFGHVSCTNANSFGYEGNIDHYSWTGTNWGPNSGNLGFRLNNNVDNVYFEDYGSDTMLPCRCVKD